MSSKETKKSMYMPTGTQIRCIFLPAGGGSPSFVTNYDGNIGDEHLFCRGLHCPPNGILAHPGLAFQLRIHPFISEDCKGWQAVEKLMEMMCNDWGNLHKFVWINGDGDNYLCENVGVIKVYANPNKNRPVSGNVMIEVWGEMLAICKDLPENTLEDCLEPYMVGERISRKTLNKQQRNL